MVRSETTAVFLFHRIAIRPPRPSPSLSSSHSPSSLRKPYLPVRSLPRILSQQHPFFLPLVVPAVSLASLRPHPPSVASSPLPAAPHLPPRPHPPPRPTLSWPSEACLSSVPLAPPAGGPNAFPFSHSIISITLGDSSVNKKNNYHIHPAEVIVGGHTTLCVMMKFKCLFTY